MASQPASGLLRLIVAHDPVCERADADLLAQFHADREQRAFAELVRRHGPMVLGVCRRVVGTAADAEDAFQAVFLVLARRTGDVRQPELLGHWLYGVAYRVARKARRVAARRRGREVPMANVPERFELPREAFPELGGILDEELARLPEWYRLPIVLCDLQGLSRTETATRLGIPEGTLSSRLATGRKKLADRLTKRGVTLSALTLFLTDQVRATVPHHLLDATVQTAITAALGGTVSTAITQLAHEGFFTMRKMLFLALTLSATTVGVALTTISADDQKTPPAVKAVAKKEDAKDEQPKTRVEWSKPRMVNYYDMDNVPTKLMWCTNQKHPFLLVEVGKAALIDNRLVLVKSSVQLYRIGAESVVTTFNLPTGHELVDVFPSDSAYVSARIENGGINALRELRFMESRVKFEHLNKNLTVFVEIDGKHENVPTVFEPKKNWLDPMKPGKVDPVHVDDTALAQFKLTPDAKGIWNAYHERNDAGDIARIGLRLLHPITGEVLKVLPDTGANGVLSLQFDRDCRYAVAWTRDTKLRIGQTSVGSHVTCWNLSKGTIAWNADIPDEMFPHNTAISADGSVTAIAYQMRDPDSYKADYAKLKKIESLSAPNTSPIVNQRKIIAEKYPPMMVRLVDTATGKRTSEIPFGTTDFEPSTTLSANGELLLVANSTISLENLTKDVAFSMLPTSHRVRVYDTRSGKLVHQWNGQGLFSFRPTNHNGSPILAVAETITNYIPGAANGTPPEQHGRLGLWQFTPVEVEDKK